ncbi:MAG: hypothetical protein ACRD2B_18210 [Terriglobia bacterium]
MPLRIRHLLDYALFSEVLEINVFYAHHKSEVINKSTTAVPAALKYMCDQEQHHGMVSFQEELIVFLRRNGIVCDERCIWE